MTTASADARPISPWLSVWLRPRQTIERIVAADPRRHVWLLASLSLIGGIAVQIVLAGWKTLLLDWRAIVGLVLVGMILGIVALYYAGFFFRWSGKLFDGRASAAEVRAAPGVSSRIFSAP